MRSACWHLYSQLIHYLGHRHLVFHCILIGFNVAMVQGVYELTLPVDLQQVLEGFRLLEDSFSWKRTGAFPGEELRVVVPQTARTKVTRLRELGNFLLSQGKIFVPFGAASQPGGSSR